MKGNKKTLLRIGGKTPTQIINLRPDEIEGVVDRCLDDIKENLKEVLWTCVCSDRADGVGSLLRSLRTKGVSLNALRELELDKERRAVKKKVGVRIIKELIKEDPRKDIGVFLSHYLTRSRIDLVLDMKFSLEVADAVYKPVHRSLKGAKAKNVFRGLPVFVWFRNSASIERFFALCELRPTDFNSRGVDLLKSVVDIGGGDKCYEYVLTYFINKGVSFEFIREMNDYNKFRALSPSAARLIIKHLEETRPGESIGRALTEYKEKRLHPGITDGVISSSRIGEGGGVEAEAVSPAYSLPGADTGDSFDVDIAEDFLPSDGSEDSSQIECDKGSWSVDSDPTPEVEENLRGSDPLNMLIKLDTKEGERNKAGFLAAQARDSSADAERRDSSEAFKGRSRIASLKRLEPSKEGEAATPVRSRKMRLLAPAASWQDCVRKTAQDLLTTSPYPPK